VYKEGEGGYWSVERHKTDFVGLFVDTKICIKIR
jgi:hypothetical protein